MDYMERLIESLRHAIQSVEEEVGNAHWERGQSYSQYLDWTHRLNFLEPRLKELRDRLWRLEKVKHDEDIAWTASQETPDFPDLGEEEEDE